MVLCWKEHTVTQILTALGLASRWRVLEHVAEYGTWNREAVERQPLRLLEQEPPARWGGYHPVAIDDTKGHRTSTKGGGTCTFHESSAHRPNRAETVRAHHGVVMGDLPPGRPWPSWPHAARLSCRRRQRPAGAVCRTKTALAVEWLRQADVESAAPLLRVFDGAYAVDTVVRPCLEPAAGQRRLEMVTDGIILCPSGFTRKGAWRWGARFAAPQPHLYWPVGWRQGQGWVYGRIRRCRDKQLRCRWAVSGPQVPVHVFVIEMAGEAKPWLLVTTALDVPAAQVVAVWAAPFRQEDGFRDHQQRLGMEECRAWTKEPILRTCQIPLVALTLLRLLQTRLNHAWGDGSWWLKPAWHPGKRQASILDLRRLFWRFRVEFTPFLLALEKFENNPEPPGRCRYPAGRAM